MESGIQPGNYFIKMEFEGFFSGRLTGMYRGTFTKPDNKKA
jgi:hypothetical protein